MSKANGSEVSRDAVLARALTGPLESRHRRKDVDRAELAEWLRAESDPDRGALRCVRFILFHATDKDERGCSSSPIPREVLDREPHIANAVTKFAKTAATLAAASGPGLHHFYAASFRKDDGDEGAEDELPSDQHHFVVTGSEETDVFGAGAYGGAVDSTVAFGHHTRLFDTLLRTGVERDVADKQRYVEQLTGQNDMIAKLLAQSIEQTRALNEAMNEKAMRDVKVQQMLQRIDAEGKLLSAGLNHVLPVVTHILAQKTGFDPKQAAAAQEQSIATRIKTLRPRQLAMFAATLDPDQMRDLAPLILGLTGEWSQDKRAEFEAVYAEALAASQLPQDAGQKGEGK